MVAHKSLKSQLARLKLHFWFFGRAEIKELRRILNSGEVIRHCAYGYYSGGSGLLVATDQRLMLIDKRPFFVNLEEMSYRTIKSVKCTQKFLQATITVNTGVKQLMFRSVSDARLKMIERFINGEVDESRHKFVKAFSDAKLPHLKKPYLNSGWRPHHTSLVRRRKPTKFYSTSRLAPLS